MYLSLETSKNMNVSLVLVLIVVQNSKSEPKVPACIILRLASY